MRELPILFSGATVFALLDSDKHAVGRELNRVRGFTLTDARPPTFVACKGALEFFDEPVDVAALLREMHASAHAE